jgi:hypothetical protein
MPPTRLLRPAGILEESASVCVLIDALAIIEKTQFNTRRRRRKGYAEVIPKRKYQE